MTFISSGTGMENSILKVWEHEGNEKVIPGNEQQKGDKMIHSKNSGKGREGKKSARNSGENTLGDD